MTGLLTMTIGIAYADNTTQDEYLRKEVGRVLGEKIWEVVHDGRDYLVEVFPAHRRIGSDLYSITYIQSALVVLNNLSSVEVGECVSVWAIQGHVYDDRASFIIFKDEKERKFALKTVSTYAGQVEYWERIS